MANPTRPASAQVIATTWGLAVADTVVRRFPNAATRDTDLTGHTSTDLLGQVVELTDTGELQVYAGPVVQWRRPWNMPWGRSAPPALSSADLNIGATYTAIISVSIAWMAGRTYRLLGEICYVTDVKGQIRTVMAGTNAIHRADIHPVAGGEFSQLAMQTFECSGSTTANAEIGVVSLFTQGSLGQHRLLVEDVGPNANPTALVAGDDGLLRVERSLLTGEYVDLWAELDAAGDVG